MIIGFHHIALLISSEECLDFYKVLGFKESFRKQRDNDCVVLLDGYGMQIEVFIDNRHPKKEKGLEEPIGTRHFALRVENIDATLEQLGMTGTDIGTDWLANRYSYIADPDGNLIELHE